MGRRCLCNACANCTTVSKEKALPKDMSEVITLLEGSGYSNAVGVLCVAAKEAAHMQDYMKALYLRFGNTSRQAQEMGKEREVLRRKLAARLGKAERRMLLRLVDLEDELREHESIEAFISGFRLAVGIQRELSEPPYSFEAENEQQAHEIFERGD